MSNPAFAALSQRMGGRSGLLTGWVSIPDPLVAGIIAREGVDCVTLDMQHGTVDVACAVQALAHAELRRLRNHRADGQPRRGRRHFRPLPEIPAAGRAELGS